VKGHPNSVLFTSLGQLRYFSALQYVDAVVGNSSSGIVEAPSFKIGTINIGNRQTGRVKAKSVIDCFATNDSLKNAFEKLYSDEFQLKLKKIENPYYQTNSSIKIKKILKNISLHHIIYKEFVDLK
jgi:GDP/UDP-N,N'-diacetylbacillosamine 2-epimerase (hydrolysing)